MHWKKNWILANGTTLLKLSKQVLSNLWKCESYKSEMWKWEGYKSKSDSGKAQYGWSRISNFLYALSSLISLIRWKLFHFLLSFTRWSGSTELVFREGVGLVCSILLLLWQRQYLYFYFQIKIQIQYKDKDKNTNSLIRH